MPAAAGTPRYENGFRQCASRAASTVVLPRPHGRPQETPLQMCTTSAVIFVARNEIGLEPCPHRAPPWVPDRVRQNDPRSESGKTKGGRGRRMSPSTSCDLPAKERHPAPRCGASTHGGVGEGERNIVGPGCSRTGPHPHRAQPWVPGFPGTTRTLCQWPLLTSHRGHPVPMVG